MWNKIKILFTSALVFIGFANQAQNTINNENSNLIDPSLSAEDTIKGPFTKKSIKERLTALAKKPAPKNLKMGAMCYDVAYTENRTDYVCPKCGQKTIYTVEFGYLITNTIPDCRNYMNSFRGLKANIDESQFCRKCSPHIKKPELCFEINYSDENKVHKTCGINEKDMQLVSEFLNQSKVHRSFNDSEEPLKNYVKRLEELLDIKITEK